MTRERISFTFDPRDMLLSLQMGFSFVKAAVACAILKRTSGLEPSSETTAPRYFKLVTVPIRLRAMVAHKAACHTLPKAFLKSLKTWYRFCWCWRYFSHRILRLKICSVVLLPALNPACSSAIISSAWGLSLFKITFSMTLLE